MSLTTGEYVIIWFLRSILVGFVLSIPLLNVVGFITTIVVSLNAYSNNRDLFNYIWLSHPALFQDLENNGFLIFVAIVVFVGGVLGSYVGGIFKRDSSKILEFLKVRIKDFKREITRR